MNRSLLPFSLKSTKLKYSLGIVALALIILYGLLPSIHSFGFNLRLSFPKYWSLVIYGVFIFYLTFILSTLSYGFLALAKIKRRQLLLVQMASTSLSLLLPAGIGNISLNYLYLRNKLHNQAQAGLVIALNNSIGVVANLSLLIVLLLVFGINNRVVSTYSMHHQYLYPAIAVLVVLTVITYWLLRSHIKKVITLRKQFISAISQYHGRLGSLAKAYTCALAQAAVTAFVFWLCLSAYGIRLDYPLAFLIYSLSVLVGAIIPTPGGLGGVEASLTAGVVATHSASASLALAAVLAYRVVSYWLPVAVGVVSLGAVERLRLIKWDKRLS